MNFRLGPPAKDTASTSYSSFHHGVSAFGVHKRIGTDARQRIARNRLCIQRTRARALLERDEVANQKLQDADIAQRTEVVEQLIHRVAEADGYVPLTEARDMIKEYVGASSAAPPKFIKFCRSGEEELRLVNYTVNGALVGLSVFLAASQIGSPGSAAAGPSLIGALSAAAQQGWELYEYLVDAHPLATKAVISGTVYGLGDLTAQTYEGRSWREFDPIRILRSSLCGFLAHGPLSHFFYERMDRSFVLSKYFDGGDAWYTPLAKIAVDQTLFAAAWNSLYYVMLGAMKFESPGVIFDTVKASWWELLKAGWRVWPMVHLVTYTIIPCEDRVLWVDMVELAWVTVLSIYGQQRRERAGAAACALPGVAGEGGAFAEDILRGMTVEGQVVFQTADGDAVVKRLDEVLVEAAMMEANFTSSLDKATRYTKPTGSLE